MNLKIASFSLLIIPLSLLFSCQGNTNNTINYSFDDFTMEAMIVDSPLYNYQDLVIPSEVNYNNQVYQVTSIAINAFKNNDYIKTLTIPDTIVSIGYDAFRDCSSLEIVNMSNQIDYLPDHLFSYCTSLTEFNGGENIKTLYKGVFEGTKVKSFTFSSLSEIDVDCFWNNQALESITILGDLDTLPGSCFERCTSLKSVNLSSSVSYIENYAFKNCSSLETFDFENIRHIENNAFESCAFTTLELNDTVLENQAFVSNLNLESVSLNGSLSNHSKDLGYGVFKDCSKLTTLTINNIESIGSNCFKNCSLETVSFDKELKEIKSEAFLNNKLKLISFEENSSLESISRKAFYNNQLEGKIELPTSLNAIYNFAFKENNIDEIKISKDCLIQVIVDEECLISYYE